MNHELTQMQYRFAVIYETLSAECPKIYRNTQDPSYFSRPAPDYGSQYLNPEIDTVKDNTVCPRSFANFYPASRFIKMAKTSRTYNNKRECYSMAHPVINHQMLALVGITIK